LLDLIGLVLEVIATIVVETVAWFAKVLFWPFRRWETPDAVATARELKAFPRPRFPASSPHFIGDLARRLYHGDGIDLGRVLSWFAKRERTLPDGNAAVIFVAVCDL
jgi:hypothetical protein